MNIFDQINLSLQTKLLILALLGMANSTLDWKPFELMMRLNLIRDITFENLNYSTEFKSSVKTLLATTVIIEFICSLLNPLAHLLKLYPIITMSRSDILMPWLVIHAVKTITPKLLSFGLVITFYLENTIPTVSFIEFLFVESINIVFAGYNWFIFFKFYLSLRDLEKQCNNQKNEMKISNSICTSLQSCSNSSSVSESISEISLHSSKKNEELLIIRPFKHFNVNDEVESDENSSIYVSSSEKNLTSAKNSLSISSTSSYRGNKVSSMIFTKFEEISDLSDFQSEKDDSFSSSEQIKITNYSRKNYRRKRKNSNDKQGKEPTVNFSRKCTCSTSSEDDQDSDFFPMKFQHNLKEKKPVISQQNLTIDMDEKMKKINPEVNHDELLIQLPTSSAIKPPNLTLDKYLYNRNNNLYLLLDKNFQLVNQMCKTLNLSSQNVFKNSNQKWLIFHHKLDSTLKVNFFFKESNSFVKKYQTDCKSLLKINNKIIDKLDIEEENKQNRFSVDPDKDSLVEHKKLLCLNDKTKTNQLRHRLRDDLQKQSFLDVSKDHSSNVVVLKSTEMTNKRVIDENKAEARRRLRNIQAYNNIMTLELDRKDLVQKKKQKSRTTRISNILSLENNECLKTEKTLDPDLMIKPTIKSTIKRSQSMRETIEKLDWNVPIESMNHHPVDPITTTCYASCSPRTRRHERNNDDTENNRIAIIDDETVSLLQSAFSYSDNSRAGFRLGPEDNEPYPIFQTVSLGVADVYKSTGWRSFEQSLRPAVRDEELTTFSTNDRELLTERCNSFTDLLETVRENDRKLDERTIKQKNISACLIEQMQNVLESSQETLSIIKNSRSRRSFANDKIVRNDYNDKNVAASLESHVERNNDGNKNTMEFNSRFTKLRSFDDNKNVKKTSLPSTNDKVVKDESTEKGRYEISIINNDDVLVESFDNFYKNFLQNYEQNDQDSRTKLVKLTETKNFCRFMNMIGNEDNASHCSNFDAQHERKKKKKSFKNEITIHT